MLKIGMVGLGKIANKAYLPVIAGRGLELHLCSRSEEQLRKAGEAYRIKNLHPNLDSLISSGIKAAFVHTATQSHFEIVEKLLKANIHVYVDKPVTADFTSTEKLVILAKERKLLLMAGFNRRHAPAISKLKDLVDPNMIIMQKNRNALPGEVRTFIFDDFIHVVDTLLFLLSDPPTNLTVTSRKKEGLLFHVVIELSSSKGCTAIGIMNRDAGTTEEMLEVFTTQEKRVVYNVTETVVYRDNFETRIRPDDWESTLYKRGFDGIISSFLNAVESGNTVSYEPILRTHKMCEEIVQQLEKD